MRLTSTARGRVPPTFDPGRGLTMPLRPLLVASAIIAALLALFAQTAIGRIHRSPRCVDAHAHPASAPRAALKAAVVCLINHERRAFGLPPLHQSTDLNRSAQGWTDTMVAEHALTHGANFADRLSAAGFNWSQAGENIATGFGTPAQVVRAWMASPDHCRNILNPQFSSIGTGIVSRGVGGRPSTWTQDFALKMGTSAPSGNWGPADSVC